MKKNIITLIILALTVLNVLLSSLIMFVVIPASNKTNNLMSQVASIIDLELESPTEKNQVSVSDIETHTFEGEITINLKKDSTSSELHFAILNVSLAINTKSPDYKRLKETVATNESFIKETIRDVFSQYTLDEAQANTAGIKEEVMKKIQEYYESDFIMNVTFGSLVFQ